MHAYNYVMVSLVSCTCSWPIQLDFGIQSFNGLLFLYLIPAFRLASFPLFNSKNVNPVRAHLSKPNETKITNKIN